MKNGFNNISLANDPFNNKIKTKNTTVYKI